MTTIPASAGGARLSGRGTWLVVLAASLWGTSALLREPLAAQLAAPTVVFFEHLVLALVLAPWLPAALRAWASTSWQTRAAVVVIGGGSSALATTLFTASFAYGDPITPQVLQKLQPLVAIVFAVVLLGERMAPRFWAFALPALGGAWLLSFADPFSVRVADLTVAGLALGAAVLWAAGTVLGRFAGRELGSWDITVLRFGFGLPAAAVIAVVRDAPLAMPLSLAPQLILLALIPGLLALMLYYRGLATTPAARATLAELAFPFTAAVVGVAFLGASLDGSQWIGAVTIVIAVMALARHDQRSRRPAVVVPRIDASLGRKSSVGS